VRSIQHRLALRLARPAPADTRVVVSGHSHQPTIERRGGILFVDPGSSGPRRFKLPVTAGELLILRSSVAARIVDLLSGETLQRVSVRPIAKGAKPLGARVSVAPMITNRNMALITTSVTNPAAMV